VPSKSLIDAFGRAPPSDEPGASKSLKSSVLSVSEINLSVADSNLGKSTRGGMLIFFSEDKNLFSSYSSGKSVFF